MKITKFLFLGIALFAVACSKDNDDPKPTLEEVKFSLAEDAQVVTIPQSLLESDNEYAAQTAAILADVNSFASMNFAYFQVPPGTTKSDRITASNGRSAATGDYSTYVWTNEETGLSAAYQVSESSDAYKFEIFLRETGESDWVKLLEASEKKDRSGGSMVFYVDTEVFLSFVWTRSGNMLSLTMESSYESYEISVNQSTGAGSVKYYSGEVLIYTSTWDAAGNGTYVQYDEEGNLESEGSWTA